MFKGVLIAKLLKIMKSFKIFGFVIKFNKFRLKLKYQKQSAKCHLIASQLAEIDHTNTEIRLQLCQARDIMYNVADEFHKLEENV